MDIAIEIKDLTIGYKSGGVLFAGMNATLHSGELTCLVGTDGVGKSTLLRTMAALQAAREGYVELMGRDILRYDKAERAALLSVVTSDCDDLEDMTAEKAVAKGRRARKGLWGRWREADVASARKWLERLGADALAKRKVKTLSAGERARVAIACALAQDTSVVLLDRVTDTLDCRGKTEILLLLRRWARTVKKAVLVCTNDLEHALQLADRVWLLDRQKGLIVGAPEDLCMDGSVAHCFESKDMAFGLSPYTFAINYETAREVVVRGDASTSDYALCCRALLRHGMRPLAAARDAEACEDVSICVPGDGTFRMMEQGKESVKVEKTAHLVGMIVPAITKHRISAIRQAADLNAYE